jgi:hypothetical protein
MASRLDAGVVALDGHEQMSVHGDPSVSIARLIES